MSKRLPELDGYRVVLIFIVSWYHIWQQSWWTISYDIDFLLRTGYMMVDGMMLLSAFLLFLPWVRASLNGQSLPDRNTFYKKRAIRILPSYYAIVLLVLGIIVFPWNLYYTPQYAVKDIFTHITMTFTFWLDTYVGTPMGAAYWTLVIECQFYLFFPYLAKACLKKPVLTLTGMIAASWLFRGWCIWSLSDFNMVVNQLPSFLDVFALGMAGALIFARIERLELSGRKQLVLRLTATLLLAAGILSLITILRHQAGAPVIQRWQMIRRFPLAFSFLLIIMSLPLCIKPIRFIFGNRVMSFLAGLSMNYYLIHQTLAVHLRRIGFPPSISDMPNMAGEMPWQWQYTLLCFGLSLLLAFVITYAVEKPAARMLAKHMSAKQMQASS